jgi:hypothetical protein
VGGAVCREARGDDVAADGGSVEQAALDGRGNVACAVVILLQAAQQAQFTIRHTVSIVLSGCNDLLRRTTSAWVCSRQMALNVKLGDARPLDVVGHQSSVPAAARLDTSIGQYITNWSDMLARRGTG